MAEQELQTGGLQRGKYSRAELSYLEEATRQELLDELARRRQNALRVVSSKEIEEELARRGVNRGDPLPNVVEK